MRGSAQDAEDLAAGLRSRVTELEARLHVRKNCRGGPEPTAVWSAYYGTVRYTTVQYSTVQYSTVHCLLILILILAVG